MLRARAAQIGLQPREGGGGGGGEEGGKKFCVRQGSLRVLKKNVERIRPYFLFPLPPTPHPPLPRMLLTRGVFCSRLNR
jgi:hypothetical protein